MGRVTARRGRGLKKLSRLHARTANRGNKMGIQWTSAVGNCLGHGNRALHLYLWDVIKCCTIYRNHQVKLHFITPNVRHKDKIKNLGSPSED